MPKNNPCDPHASKKARKVAKYLFRLMHDNQHLFKHPKAPTLPRKQWATTAWNAAWMAADAVDHT